MPVDSMVSSTGLVGMSYVFIRITSSLRSILNGDKKSAAVSFSLEIVQS